MSMTYDIISVTFNPAIDTTAFLQQIHQNELHRLHHVVKDVGGKGINVSKTIHALKGTSLCTGFLAGFSGEYIKECLSKTGIDHSFIWVDGLSRCNLKLMNDAHELTEFNEDGPSIESFHIDQLMNEIIKYSHEGSYIILSGNVPKNVPTTIYYEMIKKCKQQKRYVVLDADGELLKEGINAKPLFLKPNRNELISYAGLHRNATTEEIASYVQSLLNEDTKLIVVSMGEEGSLFICKDVCMKAEALQVVVQGVVGAGDAMVAAIVYAMTQQYSFEEMIRLAVATSAGAVTNLGTEPASYDVVQHLKEQVVMKKVIL